MKIVRPHITLITLCCVGLACFLLKLVYPENGIMFAGVKLRFGTSAAQDSLKERKIEDVGQFLAQFDSIVVSTDSTSSDSLLKVNRKETIASLQFKDGDSHSMFSFFAALDSAKLNSRKVHIFHYGDSQIESDRMSNVVRQKLQEKFGGNGPGLVAPIPITASANIMQTQSANWKRYTSYGFDNGKSTHNDYGVMCAFGRYTAAQKKDEIVVADSVEAWIELRPSSMSVSSCKVFHEAILYFGNFSYGFNLKVLLDGVQFSDESIEPGIGILSKKCLFETTPKNIRFEFKGPESPDVYGIELQGKGGVNVSNIALRGNDGGAFRRVTGTSMQPVFDELHAELFILQFGGNAVPYLKSEQSALNYGTAFKAHIRQLKKLAPRASFIIIGPSDMSTSVDGVYQTWPYLSSLNDGMKQAAFDEDCAFWDMFGVMGGTNSMVSWVTNNPPYAGPDYTHFTPAGARKVAELLSKAISDEYDAWKNGRVIQ